MLEAKPLRMSLEEILAYAAETYGRPAGIPWEKHPTYGVLRHRHNRKWFAVVMEVPRCKLHLEGGYGGCPQPGEVWNP